MTVPMFVIETDHPSRTSDTIFFNVQRLLVSNKLRAELLSTNFRVVMMISRRPLTAVVWVGSQASLYGFCGLKSDTGTGPPPVYLGFSPVSIVPPIPHKHLHQRVSLITHDTG